MAAGFSWAWALWILAFAVIEAWAIIRKRPGDTLSEHVWHLVKGRPARWILLAGFLVWLCWHLLGFGAWG